MAEYLEIPVEGKCSGLRLLIYPQSSKAKVFEEREPYAGESRWQLMEGCTYAYEFVPFETAQTSTGCHYQFERENEIVRFHPNKTSHACEGTLTTGIYVGHLTLQVVEVDTLKPVGSMSLEIRSRSIPFAIKGSPSALDLFMQQRNAAELNREPELSLDEINAEICAAREEMRKRKGAKE